MEDYLLEKLRMQAEEAVEEEELSNQLTKELLTYVDRIGLGLMEEKDSFYGYFFLKLVRSIRMDLTTPTAIWFQGMTFHMAFHPVLFFQLTPKQMATMIKHDILHLLSGHLGRSKAIQGKYKKRIANMAMDLVVNQYLDYLPPHAVTLEQMKYRYDLVLAPFETLEYYGDKLQEAFMLLEEAEEVDTTQPEEEKEWLYQMDTTHDLWELSSEVEAYMMTTLLTENVQQAMVAGVPSYLEGVLEDFTAEKGEISWQLYLKRLVGKVSVGKKKTTARRNRRQPERAELRGILSGKQAEIVVAIDSSASMSDVAYEKALKEVLAMVKGVQYAITIIECDNQIRRIYKAKQKKDLKPRLAKNGTTKFTPVFAYANQQKAELLVYFTDGKGEEQLGVVPHGYKVLWVLTGKEDSLSLRTSYGSVKKLGSAMENGQSLEMRDVRSDGYSMNNQEPIF